jgi:DNA invertase Pin-like site-specific DNA recombinase
MLVDGYVRVSAVKGRGGDRFISPAVQREQIEGWARMSGATVGIVFEELDESGGRRDRPMLLEALGRIEDGRSGGLVVAKMDRFGRSLIDGLGAIDRIEKAGGTFVSVADGLDLRTPTGKLVLRILLSMAEWELERIRDQWDVATARAVERGIHIASVAPAGYRHNADGRLEVDPVMGPLIREAFERRAAGESMRSIATWLTESEAVSAFGNPGWREGTVRQMFARTAYLGEVRKGRHVNRRAHEPLVAEVTWQQAQTPARPSPRPSAHPTLLGSLMRCAGCRMVMHATWRDRVDAPKSAIYACGAQSSAGRCPAPASISGTLLEPYVVSVAFSLAKTRPRPRQGGTAAVSALERRLAAAEAALVTYRDHPTILGTLGGDRFAAGLASRERAVERARLTLGAAERRQARPGSIPEDLPSAWPTMELMERRRVLLELLDVVFVERGHLHVHERVHICRRGEGPTALPGRGRRGGTIRPFDPAECEVIAPPARPGPAGTWSLRRLKTELARFLGDRGELPGADEFYIAGEFELHRQVLLAGGPGLWATRMGVSYDRYKSTPKWTDENITAALTPFFKGRSRWPSPEEFAAAGLGPARNAIKARGGVARWAEQFGLEYSCNGRIQWTDESIERTLREFIGDGAYYPPRREFFSAGYAPLYMIICSRDGHDAWAARLGLDRVR